MARDGRPGGRHSPRGRDALGSGNPPAELADLNGQLGQQGAALDPKPRTRRCSPISSAIACASPWQVVAAVAGPCRRPTGVVAGPADPGARAGHRAPRRKPFRRGDDRARARPTCAGSAGGSTGCANGWPSWKPIGSGPAPRLPRVKTPLTALREGNRPLEGWSAPGRVANGGGGYSAA